MSNQYKKISDLKKEHRAFYIKNALNFVAGTITLQEYRDNANMEAHEIDGVINEALELF